MVHRPLGSATMPYLLPAISQSAGSSCGVLCFCGGAANAAVGLQSIPILRELAIGFVLLPVARAGSGAHASTQFVSSVAVVDLARGEGAHIWRKLGNKAPTALR